MIGRPTPVLSVLITTCDCAAVIAATLRPLLAEFGPAMEAVVLDAGSLDSTPQIVAAMAEDHPGVRLLFAPPQAAAASTAALLAAARGTWLLWLEPGDAVAVNELRQLLEAATAQPSCPLALLLPAHLTAGTVGHNGALWALCSRPWLDRSAWGLVRRAALAAAPAACLTEQGDGPLAWWLAAARGGTVVACPLIRWHRRVAAQQRDVPLAQRRLRQLLHGGLPALPRQVCTQAQLSQYLRSWAYLCHQAQDHRAASTLFARLSEQVPLGQDELLGWADSALSTGTQGRLQRYLQHQIAAPAAEPAQTHMLTALLRACA